MKEKVNVEEKIQINILSKLKIWAFKNSIKVLYFGNSCCFQNMANNQENYLLSNKYLIEKVEGPNDANLLMIHGLITPPNLYILEKVYNEIPNPKIVVALGNCAANGGGIGGYNVVNNLEEFIEVDYYLTGCPPEKECFDFLFDKMDKILIGKIA